MTAERGLARCVWTLFGGQQRVQVCGPTRGQKQTKNFMFEQVDMVQKGLLFVGSWDETETD